MEQYKNNKYNNKYDNNLLTFVAVIDIEAF